MKIVFEKNVEKGVLKAVYINDKPLPDCKIISLTIDEQKIQVVVNTEKIVAEGEFDIDLLIPEPETKEAIDDFEKMGELIVQKARRMRLKHESHNG